MTETKTTPKAPKKLRALVRMDLRKSPDPKSPLFEEWHTWYEGDVFTPPPHMKVDLALKRGIAEEVKGG